METTPTLDAIDPFRQSLYDLGLLENTVDAYSTDVKMFFLECNLTYCQTADFPSMAANWMNRAKDNKLAAKTIRRRATSIRKFAAFCGLPPILVGYKMPPLEEQIPHPLPGLDQDLQALLDLCRTEEQHALIALLGLEGLRLFEALQVRPLDVDPSTMMLTVWGKRGKKRIIPITPRAWVYLAPAYLSALIRGSEYIVDYSDRGARSFITDLGGKARLSRSISSHDLRATFATLSYAKHRDIQALRIWLGHDSIETTQMYVAIAIEALRAAGEF